MRLVVRVDCVLFGKGLHCEVALVSEPLHFINSGKSSFSQFLDGLIEAMEAKLIEAASKEADPILDDTFSSYYQFHWLRTGSVQRKSHDS